MLTIIKETLTWWNRQTLGTRLQTIFFGKFVGEDKYGNKVSYNIVNPPPKMIQLAKKLKIININYTRILYKYIYNYKWFILIKIVIDI